MNPDFSTDVPGHMKSISLDSGEVTTLGSGEPAGNLDGVEPDGAGSYHVTDRVSGGLLHITAEGEVHELLDLPQGSADLEFVEADRLIVIPMMDDNTVHAYRTADRARRRRMRPDVRRRTGARRRAAGRRRSRRTVRGRRAQRAPRGLRARSRAVAAASTASGSPASATPNSRAPSPTV